MEVWGNPATVNPYSSVAYGYRPKQLAARFLLRSWELDGNLSWPDKKRKQGVRYRALFRSFRQRHQLRDRDLLRLCRIRP